MEIVDEFFCQDVFGYQWKSEFQFEVDFAKFTS